MHRAHDRGGRPAWVRRSAHHLIQAYAAGHAAAHDLGIGAIVPAFREFDEEGVWVERLTWQRRCRLPVCIIDRYVTAALTTPISTGVIPATGEPHVLEGGQIVIADVFVTARLEHDERTLLGRAVAFIDTDPEAIVTSTTELCRACPPGLGDAARRSCLSLRAEWTSAALGLAIYHVAAAVARAGPRAEPFAIYADEVLHRLDLAHARRRSVPSFSHQKAAEALLRGELLR